MKKFLAIYMGTPAALGQWNALDAETRKAREAKGMEAWQAWAKENARAIVDQGGPLGKTKQVAAKGIADVKNNLTGYVILEAESQEAAARLFEKHPHFTIFPGESVEIMECLPMPDR